MFKRLFASRRTTLVGVSCLVLAISIVTLGAVRHAISPDASAFALSSKSSVALQTHAAAATRGGAPKGSTMPPGSAPSTAPGPQKPSAAEQQQQPAAPAAAESVNATKDQLAAGDQETKKSETSGKTQKSETSAKDQKSETGRPGQEPDERSLRPATAAAAAQGDPGRFQSSASAIGERLKKKMTDEKMWYPGAPVTLDDLREVEVRYWDFNGVARTGQIVISKAWAAKIQGVFKILFDAHFPIRGMDAGQPVDNEGSIAVADNTRSFQARGVNGGWSMHAYGLAVDINPAENPWVKGTSVTPAAGARYVDRSVSAPGVVTADGLVVRAFKSIGWKWGGDWKGSKDYMHFSSNGH